ncbi:hypothetical protein [uncultured Desulfobulbus sp.]|uniref:hypothetical protein n=1 Tax=uncultured Desulfobulbus sp. TaxID=239745 RepID=UPI0029C74764|nr:hypothetical protein [uncultured Desulfobulbus sp.]
MTNRMHRLPFFITMLLLGVSSTAAVVAARTTEGQAQRVVTAEINNLKPGKRELGTNKPDAFKRDSRHFTKKTAQRPSEFVHLGQLILNDAFAFNEFIDFGANAFDPAIADRILATRETRWAFGRIDTGRYQHDRFPENESSQNTIKIQPMDLDFGTSNPFFGDFFRPLFHGRFTLTAEDMAPFSGLAGLEAQPPFREDGATQDTGESSTDFTVGTSRSPLAYRYAIDKKKINNSGVAWTPDLGDTRGFSRHLEDPGREDSSGKASKASSGLGASYKAFTLTGGYVRALDKRTPAELALERKESDPTAWNSEIAYSTELLRKETTLVVGYQKTSDALQYYLPEERYKTRASMALSDSTIFSLEYYQDKEYAAKNGEDSGYGITTRIGFDF